MYMAYVKSKRMGSKKRRVRKTRRIKGGANQGEKTPMEIDANESGEKSGSADGQEQSSEGVVNPTIADAISVAKQTKTNLDSLVELLNKMNP